MKKYCMINKVKKEFLDDYVSLHKNPWCEILVAIREAGAFNELIYIYGDLAIIFIECNDINQFFEAFGEKDVGKAWFQKVAPWLIESQCIDETGETRLDAGYLEKIFDLNQQLNGVLEPF